MLEPKRLEELDKSYENLAKLTEETFNTSMFLKMTMRYIPFSIWCRDRKGRFVWISEVFENTFGVTYHECMGEKCDFTEAEKSILKNGPGYHSFEFEGKVIEKVYSFPLLKKGKLIGLASIILDRAKED